jgi:hypothetical protein
MFVRLRSSLIFVSYSTNISYVRWVYTYIHRFLTDDDECDGTMCNVPFFKKFKLHSNLIQIEF